MIIKVFIFISIITNIKSTDYDDGEPWEKDIPSYMDPERRKLWKLRSINPYQCETERRIKSCKYVLPNVQILLHQKWFYIPEKPFENLKFEKEASWEIG